MIRKYIIVTAPSPMALALKVQQKLDDSWQPHGTVVVDYNPVFNVTTLMQIMVRT